eukprot:32679-Eustigmatos_ZCMA.PRE.1
MAQKRRGRKRAKCVDRTPTTKQATVGGDVCPDASILEAMYMRQWLMASVGSRWTENQGGSGRIESNRGTLQAENCHSRDM